jgi:hypothetical protein
MSIVRPGWIEAPGAADASTHRTTRLASLTLVA